VQTATKPAFASALARSFPAEPESATAARHFVVGVLESLVDEESVAVAALLTSELATNSVLHAGTAVDVELTFTVDRVRIEVSDAHPTAPRRVDADPYGTFGRGLALVDAMSAEWGVSRRAAGKGVWFSIDT
jgi:anti-sigma regulatory factor (Ser/Thr protein kinase)